MSTSGTRVLGVLRDLKKEGPTSFYQATERVVKALTVARIVTAEILGSEPSPAQAIEVAIAILDEVSRLTELDPEIDGEIEEGIDD